MASQLLSPSQKLNTNLKNKTSVNIKSPSFVADATHRPPTGENEDEEGADPSDDADDLAHVGDVHGDEEGDGDPDDGEDDPAAALKRPGDDAPAVPLEAHHQVQDDRSGPRTRTQSQNPDTRVIGAPISGGGSPHLPRRRIMG